jgi:hypothetical protein
MDPAVTIRAVRDRGDVEALIALCSQAFPEEVRAQGVEPQKYRELKTEDMLRQPFLWPQCGAPPLAPGRRPCGAPLTARALRPPRPNQFTILLYASRRRRRA